MDQPLVSVIVPVYKVEIYLRKAVDSVLNQTYKNLEIILVDDGSPDKCPEICDEYAQQDKRVKVIHKSNGGLSDARNKALDVMKGNLVMFVDSDDYISHDTIDGMLTALHKFQVDTVCCGLNFVDEYGVAYRTEKPVESFKTTGVDIVKLIVEGRYPHNYACGKLYKASLWDGFRFPAGRLYEDIATIYKVICRAKNVYCLNKSYYNYLNIREGNISSELRGEKAAKSYWHGCLNTEERIKYFASKTEYSDLYPILYNQMYSWAKLTIESAIKLGKNAYKEYVDSVYEILSSSLTPIPFRLRLIIRFRTLYYYIYPLIGRNR